MSDHADLLRRRHDWHAVIDRPTQPELDKAIDAVLAENEELVAERNGSEKAARAETEQFMAQLDDAKAENQRLRDALAWYDVHKRSDGSYDGEMYGDLRALAAVREENDR